MGNKKIASWARSMAQLMEFDKVTKQDVEMVLDAHGLNLCVKYHCPVESLQERGVNV